MRLHLRLSYQVPNNSQYAQAFWQAQLQACICIMLHGLQEDKRLKHHDQLSGL